MRIGVTGGSGFIGRPLVARLKGALHQVSASDARGSEGVVTLDLRDRAAVADWIGSVRPEIVVALGAISGPMVAPDDPQLVFDVNAGGTLNLLEAMRTSGAARLVLISSIAVYAARGDTAPVPESAALAAVDSYSGSKVAAEAMAAAYAASCGIQVTVLRVSTVYGPHRATPYMIGDLIQSGRDGTMVRVSGQTASMRQYVHVEDVVSAIVLAAERPLRNFTALNITGASYVSEIDVADLIKRLLPGTRYVVDMDRIGGDGDFGPLDIAAAARLLGYAPQIALEEGLRALALGP